MSQHSVRRFLLIWAGLGLAIAVLVLLLRPQWLQPSKQAYQEVAHARADIPGMHNTAQRLSFADAVEHAAPAVVNIYTARVVTELVPGAHSSRFLGGQGLALRQRVQNSLGSGVIVDTAGRVVTNHHVIRCAQQIWLQLADGRSTSARIVGIDPETDIAVLSIDLNPLPTMPLGHSEQLRIGDVVLAIGNPYGLSQTVTQGVISATGRGQLGLSTFENFIQTDAAINLGNSGGALINTAGELVGINTAVLAQELGTVGIGFAIPVNLVRGVLEQIIEFGRVKRGWLGVETQDVNEQQAAAAGLTTAGIIVTKIYPNNPAARDGILPGDIITRINGKPRSWREALNLIASLPPGNHIALRILRAGGERDVQTTLIERSVLPDNQQECDRDTVLSE